MSSNSIGRHIVCAKNILDEGVRIQNPNINFLTKQFHRIDFKPFPAISS